MGNPLADIDTSSLQPPHQISDVPTSASSLSLKNDYGSEETIDYGYRYVREIGHDGTERLFTIPLTRDDVIHPQLGDVQLHNDPHQVFCIYLYSLFKSQLRSDPSAVVFQDTGIFWDDPALRVNSPDVTVILGVKEQRMWTSFDVAEEGVRPELVAEVTSPETRSIDLIDKLRIYEQARVPCYIIVETDRKRGLEVLRLHGYELTTSGYEEMPFDERGWLWLQTVRLFIGIQDGRVVCFDRSGRRMGNYAEVTAELEAKGEALAAEREARTVAEAYAAAEAQARAEAEAQLRELQAEIQRLRSEA
ncbi:MAG: Uma2 family endonuclease [Armatimonadota bacterium]|nr:Uma2 family endonuclease [Armatimonadota bacterium]